MRFCAHAEAGLCCTSSIWRRAPRPSDPPATLPPLIRACVRACVRACTARPAIRQVPRHQNSLVAAAPGSEESMNLHTRSHTSTHEAVAAGHSPPRTFLPYALQHRAPHVPSTGGITRLSRRAGRRPQTSCFPGRAQQRSCRRRSSPSCPGECVSEREPASCRDPMNNQRTTSMRRVRRAHLLRNQRTTSMRRVRRAHLLRSSHVATSLHAFAPNGVHTFVTPASSGSLSSIAAKGCAERPAHEPCATSGWARRGPARRRAAESRST